MVKKDDSVSKKRAEWRRIMGNERDGRLLDDAPIAKAAGKEDKLRKLLSLMIKSKRIKFSEASRILDVDGKELETLVSALEKKKLVNLDNQNHMDPTIEATEVLARKINEKKARRKKGRMVSADIAPLKKQLVSQRNALLAKTRELEEEYKKRVELEERLRNVEKRLGSEVGEKEKLEELREQLMQEREERIRIEEKLKHEESHLTEQEEELKKRESELVEKEIALREKEGRLLEEEEELELLYGDEKELNEKRRKVKKEISDIRKMKSEIKDEKKQIDDKKGDAGEKEDDVKRMELSLKSREEGIEKREEEFIEKEEEIREKTDELSKREKRILEKETELQSKAKVLRRIKEKIIKDKEEISDKELRLKREAEALIDESKQLEDLLLNESQELKTREKELKEIIKTEIKKLSKEDETALSEEDERDKPPPKPPEQPPTPPPAGNGEPANENEVATEAPTTQPNDASGLTTKETDSPLNDRSAEQAPSTQTPDVGSLRKAVAPPHKNAAENELSAKQELQRAGEIKRRQAELAEEVERLSQEPVESKEDLLRVVAASPGIKMVEAGKKLGVDVNTVEAWAQQLREDGIIEVKKKLIGGSTLDLVRGAAEKVKTQKHDAELNRIKQELQKIHDEGG